MSLCSLLGAFSGLYRGVKAVYDVSSKYLPAFIDFAKQLESESFTERQNRLNRMSNEKLAKKQRKLTERESRLSREFEELQTKIKQNFDLEMQERSACIQRELAYIDHNYRLEEQKKSFSDQKALESYKKLMENWPLIIQPELIREAHTSGCYATLGVFLFKNRDRIDTDVDRFWDTEIYSLVESELNQWVEDNYHNNLGIRNIKFYPDSFCDSNAHHDSLVDVIRYSMRGLPTIVLECNVLSSRYNLYSTLWGLGDDPTNQEYYRCSFYSEDYKVKIGENFINEREVKRLANWICACFKMIIGCNFDAFRLIQYNEMPVFPKIAKAELENGSLSGPLRYGELKERFDEFYKRIYDLILGSDSNIYRACAYDKFVNAYALRLCYAKELKDFIEEELLSKWLNNSVEAWCSLRGREYNADSDHIKNLNWIKTLVCDQCLFRYFSYDDVGYFEELFELYPQSDELKNLYKDIVILLKDKQNKLSKNEFADPTDTNSTDIGENEDTTTRIKELEDQVTKLVGVLLSTDLSLGEIAKKIGCTEEELKRSVHME